LVPLDQILEIVQAGETVLRGNCFMFRPCFNGEGETKFWKVSLTGRKETNMQPLSQGLIFLLGVAVLIPIVGMITGMVMQRFKTQERLRMIEKGLPLPPERAWQADDPWEDAANFRIGGLVLIAVGLGLLALLAGLSVSLPQFPKGIMAASAIPFLIGVALVYESRVRIRELGPRRNQDIAPRPDGPGL
jgi:hypothetical protein